MSLSDVTAAGTTAAAMDTESNTCSARLSEGLRSLYSSSELCDMTLICQGERFPAHKAMLAAMSENFRAAIRQTSDNKTATAMEGLLKLAAPAEAAAKSPAKEAPVAEKDAGSAKTAEATSENKDAATPASAGSPSTTDSTNAKVETKAEEAKASAPASLDLDVEGIATAEAIKILLGYMYDVGTGGEWTYEPSTAEVNKDVLRLASDKKFGLKHLHEHAARWLAKGLTTGNVVERLVTCDEFGLDTLRTKIIDQLTANPAELMVVSSSQEIMKHPQILQDLLCQFARVAARPAPVPAPAAEEKPKEEKREEEKPAEPKEEEPKEEEPVEKKRKLEKVNSNTRMSNKAAKAAPEKPGAKKAKRAAAGA